MRRTAALLFSCLTVAFVTGCRSNTPADLPQSNAQPQSTKAVPDPKTGCEAITDAAQAEDCRLWHEVQQAKKKSHSNNVVKHSPGSIQQP